MLHCATVLHCAPVIIAIPSLDSAAVVKIISRSLYWGPFSPACCLSAVPPTISSGPENVVAIEGGDVALHCQVRANLCVDTSELNDPLEAVTCIVDVIYAARHQFLSC